MAVRRAVGVIVLMQMAIYTASRPDMLVPDRRSAILFLDLQLSATASTCHTHD